jgi:hypothetical protein
MTSAHIWFLVISFAAIALFTTWKALRISWPDGPRMTRTGALGVEVVVIDAPGSDGQKLLLLDACAMATTSLITAWRTWRVYAREPEFIDALDAAEVFPLIGVHFVDDALMADIQHTFWNGTEISAYLTEASSSFRSVPLVVIRKSRATEMLATGQPFIHETLHALLNRYLPDARGVRDHTHIAWDLVQGAACRTYLDLYATPKNKNGAKHGSQ